MLLLWALPQIPTGPLPPDSAGEFPRPFKVRTPLPQKHSYAPVLEWVTVKLLTNYIQVQFLQQ